MSGGTVPGWVFNEYAARARRTPAPGVADLHHTAQLARPAAPLGSRPKTRLRPQGKVYATLKVAHHSPEKQQAHHRAPSSFAAPPAAPPAVASGAPVPAGSPQRVLPLCLNPMPTEHHAAAAAAAAVSAAAAPPPPLRTLERQALGAQPVGSLAARALLPEGSTHTTPLGVPKGVAPLRLYGAAAAAAAAAAATGGDGGTLTRAAPRPPGYVATMRMEDMLRAAMAAAAQAEQVEEEGTEGGEGGKGGEGGVLAEFASLLEAYASHPGVARKERRAAAAARQRHEQLNRPSYWLERSRLPEALPLSVGVEAVRDLLHTPGEAAAASATTNWASPRPAC